jgi:hypothetical protein
MFMKKIVCIAIFSFSMVIFCPNLQATTLPLKHLTIQKKQSSLKAIKKKKSFVWPVANIGWTDACGVCWEYNITAPDWNGIWAIVDQLDIIYETGFCGYVVYTQ